MLDKVIQALCWDQSKVWLPWRLRGRDTQGDRRCWHSGSLWCQLPLCYHLSAGLFPSA